MLLDQVTKMKFDNRLFSPLSELSNCTKNIKHLSIKVISDPVRRADQFFKGLIELISVQKNLEYFDLRIAVDEVSELRNKEPKWEQLFLTLSNIHLILSSI